MLQQNMRPLDGLHLSFQAITRKNITVISIIVLFFSFAVYFFFNYQENRKTTIWYEEHSKKIMKEALLDLSKYPGSSEVVFESYNDYPHADFITADGYIDMANGFGVKTRYKFHFHVTDYGTRNSFFFSLYGGQKIVHDKKNLGMIVLTDMNGKDTCVHADKMYGLK